MLIPNKFNGYRRDGTRNLYIGGGVGEAALLQAMMTGAAVGGGTSIIQGKDPLQGALLGGLMGGAGAGVSSALGGGAGAAGAVPGAAAAETAAILPEAISAQTGSGIGALNPDFAPMVNTAGAGAPGTSMLGSNPAVQYSIDSMPATAPSAAGPQSMFGRASQAFSELTPKQQLLAGGAGIAGLGMVGDQLRGGVPKKKPYTGALSQYRFDPGAYRPYSYAAGGQTGGIASLGSYSDGGRMLKGPGDGMSDNIPASIGGKQPARLADGEFVVPADVVSHLGNGSTDAGAKQLYSMMNKVRKARTGNPKQGRQISAGKYLPA
jgi:hypothetical protein